MKESIRVPGSFDIPTRFFSQFTPLDLARIGCPLAASATAVQPAAGLSLGAVAPLLVGAGVGAAWYLARPYGRTVDQHLSNAGMWSIEAHGLDRGYVANKQDDHVETVDGSVVGVIEIEPTNLEMKTGDGQRALHRRLQRLYESITFPIEIHSRQSSFDLEAYGRHIDERSTSISRLQEEYREYVSELSTRNLAATKHYIVVRAEPAGASVLDDLLPDDLTLRPDTVDVSLTGELDSRCREVVDAISSGDLSAERLTGQEFYRWANRVKIRKPDPGPTWVDRRRNGVGEYRKTVYVSELPASSDLAWTLPVLRSDGLIDVTQVVNPVAPGKATKRLQRLSEKLEAEIDSFVRQGYTGTNKLESTLADVEWFQDLLAERQTTPVEYAAYITVHSRSRDKCLQGFNQVCNRLRTMQIDYQVPVFQTPRTLNAVAPLRYNDFDQSSLMPASSAAAGFPFGTRSIDEETGVIFGEDIEDGTPLLLNRFNWPSHSMVRMGATGSGKTYATLSELLRSYLAYDDLNIWILDPKPDYRHLARTLDGSTYELEEDSFLEFHDSMADFYLPGGSREADRDRLVNGLRHLYTKATNTADRTLVVVDEAHRLLNDPEGRDVLSVFVREARASNTGLTIVTQNASDFTDYKEGRDLLDNVPGKAFMRHERVPDSVVDYFDLSQREKQDVLNLKDGTNAAYSTAILKVSGHVDTRLKLATGPQEHAVIETEGSQ